MERWLATDNTDLPTIEQIGDLVILFTVYSKELKKRDVFVEFAHFPCLSLKIYYHCLFITTKFFNTREPFLYKNLFRKKKKSFVWANVNFTYNFQCRNSLNIHKDVSNEVTVTELLNLKVLAQAVNISKKGTLFVALKGLRQFIYCPYITREYKNQKDCSNS
jgi:hypothetical protein